MIPLRAHKVLQNETKVPKAQLFQKYLIKLSDTYSHSPLETSIQILIFMYHV